MGEGQDGRKSPGGSPGALAELPQEGMNWIMGDPRDRLPSPAISSCSKQDTHALLHKQN